MQDLITLINKSVISYNSGNGDSKDRTLKIRVACWHPLRWIDYQLIILHNQIARSSALNTECLPDCLPVLTWDFQNNCLTTKDSAIFYVVQGIGDEVGVCAVSENWQFTPNSVNNVILGVSRDWSCLRSSLGTPTPISISGRMFALHLFLLNTTKKKKKNYRRGGSSTEKKTIAAQREQVGKDVYYKAP